jgi:glycosyltransferase involved in cell wall biosynthesis
VDAARGAGVALEVLAPPGVDDPRVDRVVWGPSGRAGGHLWEQALLPAVTRTRVVLSVANTAPLAGRRNVVWVHDLAPRRGPHWFRPSMRAYGRLVVEGARRAAVVLTPSVAVAGEVVEAGVAADRVAVVRTPVDPRFQRASADRVAAARRAHGLGQDYVVAVGWPDPRKDAVTAAAAHLAVVDRRPHDLVLVGRPHPTFAPVELPVARSIRVLGFVGDDEMVALLSGAAALLFPSRYEGFGLPPLEAMACGTPAIVSELPVLRESTAGAATYVPAGDVAAWSDALEAVLVGGVTPGDVPPWSSADMAAQLTDALDRVR